MRGLRLALVLSTLAIGAPAMAQASYSVEAFAPAQQITIQGTGVRLRAEPSTATPVMSSGSTGLPLTVNGIAHQSDWSWYRVTLRNGQTAYIRSDLTSAPLRGNGAPAPTYTTAAATPAPLPPVRQLPPAPVPQPYAPQASVGQPPLASVPAYIPPAASASPAYPPAAQPAAPAATQSAASSGGGAISLFPTSPMPAPNSGGLESRSPGL